MGELFDPGKLFRVPYESEIVGPLSIIYLIVFIAGFVAATALYFRPPARVKGHALRLRLSRRIAQALMWTFGIGLAFFVFRVLGLPGLGWRLWLYVSALALAAVIGYFLYYLRTQFPAQLAAYEAQQLKRQYQLTRRRRPAGEDGAPVPRSPRAEKRRQRSGTRSR